MNRINPIHAVIFVVVLAAIAVVLHFSISNFKQHRQIKISNRIAAQKAAEEQKEATQTAAAERASYLARYLNSGFVRQTNVEMIALVAASENDKVGGVVGNAIARRLKTDGVRFLPSFFKAGFVSDGLFSDMFNGSSEPIQKLELTNSLDGVLLARESVDYAANPSLDNATTANMRLDVVLQSISPNIPNQSWTFSSSGIGFKREDARAQAEERIIRQITNDTNMTLNAIP